MLPSAVNDTMRDMMAQIRDVGDGIRGGTYTMTAPVITGGSITGVALTGNTFTSPVISGGSINNTPIGATTASTGAFSTLSVTGATTFSGATVANTFSSSGATITGGTINGTTVGATTAAAGKFTTLEATGVTTVQAGTAAAPAITTTGDTNTGIFFPAADTIAFTEGGAESMRIDSSGNLLVGTTSYASNARCMQIEFTGQINVGSDTTATYNRIVFQNPNGTIGTIQTTGSSTAYNTSSDYRLKENIAPMTGALARVSALKPVTYNWKVDGSDGQGFIAHELQEVVPECVTGEKDAVETYTDEDGNEQTRIKAQGIDTSFLVATLTAAIQELKATVDAQAARIAALENPSVEN
jgi:hypothetical protein